ncbi:MAG: hypothetical protein ACI8XO_002369 [Verrucomicrobiales bacterium]|jgi:hypothetical protein
MKIVTRMTAILLLSSSLPLNAQEAEISISKGTSKVEIKAGDQPFAELRFGPERSKPVLYPIFGPGQVKMTRDFPFSNDTKGEKHDHPHHESLWYTHGNVNGISFWHIDKNTGTIKQTGVEISGDTIITSNDWLGPDEKRVCSDQRVMKFSILPDGSRLIDFTVTINASDGDVTFGDTKEGSMGIRTHHLLRTDKGAEVTNSAGQKGKSIWGKPAKWVNYQSKIEGKPIGVAMFDSPQNPRHPTTWHARDYGLVAANPFGAHDFSKAKKGTGDLVIKSGESVKFRYAIVFHKTTKPIEDIYNAWAK